jgi:hypothetical protein
VQVFASLWFIYVSNFGIEMGGAISGRFSNKRSWVIYGGITQLLRSGKGQGRFAKSCPSIRETSIVLQEDQRTASGGNGSV